MRNALQSTNRCTSRLPEGQLSAKSRPSIYEFTRRFLSPLSAITGLLLNRLLSRWNIIVTHNGGSEIWKLVLSFYQTSQIIRDTQHADYLRNFDQTKRVVYTDGSFMQNQVRS